VTRHLIELFSILILASVLACDDDEPVEPEPSGPTEATEPPEGDPSTDQSEPGPTGELMREHFIKVRETRQALIGDDIEAAKEAMQWLADNDPGTDALPEQLRGMLDAMREKAGDFGEATTLTEASESFAGMLNHCGECHTAIDGGPEFATPPLEEGDEIATQMMRHRWAIERMWEGIVSRDEEIYVAGAEILEDVRLRPEELPQGVVEPERIDAIIEHVHEEGAAAKESAEWPERTEHFGRLIATCATCHRAMGTGVFARAAIEAEQPAGP
jgi:cytochrome c553